MSIPVGKGMFLWQIKRVFGGDPKKIADDALRLGLDWVCIKIADRHWSYNLRLVNGKWVDDRVAPVVSALKDVGIDVWGWQFVYLSDGEREAEKAAERIKQFDLKGLLIDAESHAKNAADKYNQARKYSQVIIRENIVAGLCSYRYPTLHRELPWKEFLKCCTFHCPQVYWAKSTNPAKQLNRSIYELKELKDIPVIPAGAAYEEHEWKPTAEEMDEFNSEVKSLQLSGLIWWEWAEAVEIDVEDVIASHKWNGSDASPSPDPPIIVPIPTPDPTPPKKVHLYSWEVFDENVRFALISLDFKWGKKCRQLQPTWEDWGGHAGKRVAYPGTCVNHRDHHASSPGHNAAFYDRELEITCRDLNGPFAADFYKPASGPINATWNKEQFEFNKIEQMGDEEYRKKRPKHEVIDSMGNAVAIKAHIGDIDNPKAINPYTLQPGSDAFDPNEIHYGNSWAVVKFSAITPEENPILVNLGILGRNADAFWPRYSPDEYAWIKMKDKWSDRRIEMLPPIGTKIRVTSWRGLNMRNTPSDTGVIIDKLPIGTPITIERYWFGADGIWVMTFFNGKYGWVCVYYQPTRGSSYCARYTTLKIISPRPPRPMRPLPGYMPGVTPVLDIYDGKTCRDVINAIYRYGRSLGMKEENIWKPLFVDTGISDIHYHRNELYLNKFSRISEIETFPVNARKEIEAELA